MTSLAARAIAMRDGDSLPALVQRAASQLASATTAAEVLEARDFASVAYDVAKKAARLQKAKGAHDELIAKAHRAQADALEIEAAAKRRLADEYDAAQERGEVQRHGGQGKRDISEQNIPSVKQIGLTAQDIHDARLIRDAEVAEPGIIKMTIEKQLEAGQEPTKASIRKAIATLNEEQTVEEASEGTRQRVPNTWVKIAVPEGADIADLCRRGIALEAEGAIAIEAAKAIGLSERTYAISRQIVMLADNPDLSAADKEVAQGALTILRETLQITAAWTPAVEKLAGRVWGAGSRLGLLNISSRRLEQFERSFGIVMQSCLTTDEIDLPYISTARAQKAVKEIRAARDALLRFAKRIEEIHG